MVLEVGEVGLLLGLGGVTMTALLEEESGFASDGLLKNENKKKNISVWKI